MFFKLTACVFLFCTHKFCKPKKKTKQTKNRSKNRKSKKKKNKKKSALRGVAIQRSRAARAVFPPANAAAAFRIPTPLAAAGAANALHGFTP